MDVTDDHDVALGIENAQDALGGIDVLNRVGRSVELIGGLALAFGIFQRVAAGALIAFLVAATFVRHAFWLAAAGTPVFVGQLINFLKNLAMMGGLLFVASTQSQPALSRSIYGKVRNGAVLTAARQPQP